ncbi:MAG: adenylosuccinate synthase [Oscillospiraceae bacterium]|nr:adenylosuccinate synthase [Oscillospiraceae bacterium]
MPTKVVVGVQWGDEGKGKIIDILASKADVVVRSQGGNNAGHTVENNNQVYKLHLIPSGILYKDALCLIGCGVVIDPKVIISEIDGLIARGISCENLFMDPRAHIIMPWHIEIDHLSEKELGEDMIGTTKRGIGPCYMDKAERIGIRLVDLLNENLFAEKALKIGKQKNKIITKIYNGNPLNIEQIIIEYQTYAKRLIKYVKDVSIEIYNTFKQNKNILFEGAQGTLLDIDMGTYPFVTSSHPISAGVCIGSGIGPTMIDEIIGVVKAYTTRVGKGPFPTELLNETGEKIRKLGNEFGTTTGRPRRVGWFDAVILRHSVRVNGLTSLAINKLDTLSGMEEIMICKNYKKTDGTIIDYFPPSLEELAECSPIYESCKGFTEDITNITSYDMLPNNCKLYLKKVEELSGCKISMIGVGPSRSQNFTV